MSVLIVVAADAPRSARAAVFGEAVSGQVAAGRPDAGRGPDDAFLDRVRRRVRRGVSQQNPALTAPGAASSRTAVLLGLPWRVDQRLRAPDFGAWQGRSLDDVAAAGPDAVAAWTRDAMAAPPGGESLADLAARLRDDVLPRAASGNGADRTVMIAPSLVVRALVVGALELPAAAVQRVDVEPWSVTTLTHHGGRWNLRLSA